jgi:outer membrane protein assembly factor BamB
MRSSHLAARRMYHTRAYRNSLTATEETMNRHEWAMISVLLAITLIRPATGTDWPQFRGPAGNGVSPDIKVPIEWSDTKHLKWKTALPGPGSSSPIVSGQYIFVTCYSGYGVDSREGGRVANLKRHLLCLQRASGKIVWSRSVDAALPEDGFGGMGITEHGYASSTPVTDGQRVYVFFGKTGVLSFDFQGNELWRADVGHESSNRRWGSAASPILYQDKLIVNASEESRSIRVLDKLTGKELWKAEAAGLELTYATPAVVELGDGRKELVIGVPGEAWGLNPDTGKLRWYAATRLSGNVAPSPIAQDGIVYLMGGYPVQQTVAIRAGGKGNVTTTHVIWSSRESSYISSPLLHKGNLYWVSDEGIANCAEAGTGRTVYRERLPRVAGGGTGKPFYASVVLGGERLYAVSRTGGTYVLSAKPTFEVLAHNQFASDASDFNGSPAISDGQILLRSNRFLYCIAAE